MTTRELDLLCDHMQRHEPARMCQITAIAADAFSYWRSGFYRRSTVIAASTVALELAFLACGGLALLDRQPGTPA